METLLDIAIRSGAILAIGLGVTSLFRRRLSAAEKHTILLLSLIGALLLPLGMRLMPKTPIEVPQIIAEKRALPASLGEAPSALAEAFPATPASATLFRMSGNFPALTSSALSLFVIAEGVPAGATQPYHENTS